MLRRLARLFGTSADVLLGISDRSAEAEHLATAFDALDKPERDALLKVCKPYLEQARNTDPSPGETETPEDAQKIRALRQTLTARKASPRNRSA